MLTARGEEADIVAGLEIGADDYVTKPFSPRVLLARVKAVLRRKAQEKVDESSTIRIDDLVIDPSRHEVKIGRESVALTRTEFRILQFLAGHPGRVFTRYQIVDAVHGSNYIVTDRAVDVQVAGLRKKLGRYRDRIETVRGIGYRFED
jgi:two-component system phosphate regulon response regulator PhoB